MNIAIDQKTNHVLKDGQCIDCFQCIQQCPKDALYIKSCEAINGTIASSSMMGLICVGNVVTEKFSSNDTYEVSEIEGKYKDGTYEGQTNGYRGIIKVQVVVINGHIAKITIISSDDNTEYLNRAKSIILDDIIKKQSLDVATVSGATYSSRGLINAIQAALDSEDKSQNEVTQQNSSVDSSLDFHDLNDGEYEGTGQGRNGSIDVSVVVKDKKGISITIESHREDEPFYSKAKAIVDTVIDEQSLNVEAVSGATMSSQGLLEAIADSLDIEYTNHNNFKENYQFHKRKGFH